MTALVVFITDFGDAGVVTPLCIAVALTLVLLGLRHAAYAWIGVMAAVWGTMLALKLGGYAIHGLAPHLDLPPLDLVTPSGHAAAAAAAYGGIVALFSGSPRRAALAALAIAVLIGVTRIALGDHTTAEVIVGGIVGTLGAYTLGTWIEGRIPSRTRMTLFGVAAVTMLVFHGSHVTWEQTIRATSAIAVRELVAKPL